MIDRLLSRIVIALAGGLFLVLIGHSWERYSQQADAWEFGRIYEQYLAAHVGSSSKDPDPYRSVEGRAWTAGVQEASALEE
jgi:hypothetical protein